MKDWLITPCADSCDHRIPNTVIGLALSGYTTQWGLNIRPLNKSEHGLQKVTFHREYYMVE